jgi:hypothetical protein
MNEYDLRIAIRKELEVSIQEISPDFMLIPRQIEGYDAFDQRIIDLLFYHRNIQCMITIYLKFTDSNIDDIEWMKQNLQVLIRYKVHENDKKPFGFIVCVLENAEHVELVQLDQNDGWISKKFIKFPLKQIIKAIFHEAVLNAQKQLAIRDVSGGT